MEILLASWVVSNVIPISITEEDFSMLDIVSLPCLTGSAFNSAQDIPLHNNLLRFLVNASGFSKYHIIGRKNIP